MDGLRRTRGLREKVPKGCGFPGCGRPVRATGLCQTHYKQQLRRQKLKPIAGKRAKREGTVRYGGLSLTEQCVSVMRARAKRESLAANAIITDILENWARRRQGKP